MDLNNYEFNTLLKGIIDNPEVLRMKKFIQHGNVSTYNHCLKVAWKVFIINRKFNLKLDEKILVKAAFLHDYFLYDWHDHNDSLHGYHHAKIAKQNARRDFAISSKEASIIESHMWPLNLTKIPKSREAWLLCIVDKMVSLDETLR